MIKNYFYFFFLLLPHFLFSAPSLKNNLNKAEIGDYIVTSQNKNYTLLRIAKKIDQIITIEEITVPQNALKHNVFWKEWVKEGAPYHTSWILYNINMENGDIQDCYSFSQHQWITIPKRDQFLSSLLNLHLQPIADKDRRKIGPPPSDGSPDWRNNWQPKMIVEGKVIPDIKFTAWHTTWANDGSELSGKSIDIYLPEENDKFPSYFPYWLQLRGKVGKATVHIVDSGKNLKVETADERR